MDPGRERQNCVVVESPRGTGAALVVIDMQLGLFDKPTPVFRAETLLANLGSLIAGARAAGVGIVYVQHSSQRQLLLGSADWQLHPGLSPAAGEPVVRKTHGDAFEDTTLAAELAARGVGRIFVTGLVTHGCVRATSLGALMRGYDVVVVADAHSSYSRDAEGLVEEWNRRLAEAGASVLSTAEVLTSWTRPAAAVAGQSG